MTRTATYYHCSLKPISRSAGRSAVACVAYRTGTTMEDVRYGVVRDFSRKNGVVASFTLAPDDAPAWARDMAELWNAVEAKENRKNAQLAFEWEVALPNELDDAKREAIARDFAEWLVDEYGVAVTVGIHSGGDRGNGRNDHMHVMMTCRPLDADGWAKNKLRDFNTRPGTKNPEVDRVRERVADLINDALDEAGSDERVDHRSYEARGIDVEPTTHLGPNATAIERRQGTSTTERGDINREIMEARLVWQQDEAQPEITADLDREFSARFGDPLHEQRMEEAQAGGELPAEVAAHATAEAEPVPEDTATSGERILPEPPGWKARMRALRDTLVAFWHDETSGAPEASRGLLARIVDAGRKVTHAWGRRDAPELVDALMEAGELTGETYAEVSGQGFSAFAAEREKVAGRTLAADEAARPDPEIPTERERLALWAERERERRAEGEKRDETPGRVRWVNNLTEVDWSDYDQPDDAHQESQPGPDAPDPDDLPDL